MKTKLKQVIPVLILLIGLIVVGLFFMGKKSVSFVVLNSEMKNGETEYASQAGYVSTEPVKILFVGDMMFDRYIRQVGGKKGFDYVLADVKKNLSENDLVVGNLEGPITGSPSVSVDSEIGSRNNYIFTFDSATGKNLWNSNIRLVNIGNNHILNFGEGGLVETKENLKRSGVEFFGDPAGQNRISVWEKSGIKIVFVAYNQFESDAKNKTMKDINLAKETKADKIVLYTHWGKEFIGESSENIKILAHEFVDSGVDLIIGSHPHVIQNKEIYKGKTIYYSLGNFVFDQYFSSETQNGLLVQIEIDSKDKNIVTKEFQVTMKSSGQTLQKK